MSRNIFFLVLFLNLFSYANAQKDTVWNTKPTLNLSAFADVFYIYDFGRPNTTRRQNFLYNHNRHGEFNLNLGLIKLNVTHKKYRGNLGFQAGTYVADNYINEPNALRNISEANVGISISKKNRVWLDAGIMPSHIGFESAISSKNYTLTRSLSAENSPYFEAGAKISFQVNDKWSMAGYMLNGWQRIQKIQGSSLQSFGTQLEFRPNKKLHFNWSTFIGTIDPDTSRRMRYFSNMYVNFQASSIFNIIAGVDFGVQQQKFKSVRYHPWATPTIIGQVKLNSNWKTAIRMEYFHDDSGVIIKNSPNTGVRIFGFSMNFDYSPTPNIICRFEGRWLSGNGFYFVNKIGGTTQENFILGGSLAFLINQKLEQKN